VGVSYSLKKFTGRLPSAPSVATGAALTALARDNYSLDVGGAYASPATSR
jgi:hypothetical protein